DSREAPVTIVVFGPACVLASVVPGSLDMVALLIPFPMPPVVSKPGTKHPHIWKDFRIGHGLELDWRRAALGSPRPTWLVASMITNGGFEAITLSLLMEYAKNGIRFNAVVPGEVNTPMHANDSRKYLRSLSPMEISEIQDTFIRQVDRE